MAAITWKVPDQDQDQDLHLDLDQEAPVHQRP